MKKQFIRVLLAAVLALSVAGTAAAQDDFALFRDGAGEASLLYRGHKSFDHNMLFNGTNFWTSPVYKPGTVIFNGKHYRDIELNIDAARQDLIVRIGNGVSNKVLEREFVQECTIGHRFLNLQYLYGDSAPSGYWEVIYDGRNKVLCRVTKRLEQDVDGSKRDETHYEGIYRDNLYQTFTYTANYCFLQEDGRIIPVRRRKDVLQLVDKSQRREVRREIRRHEGSGLLPLDRYCTMVAQYLESR